MKERIKTRKLTRQDVAFVLELKSEGVKLCYIAKYVYNTTSELLKSQLETWGAV